MKHVVAFHFTKNQTEPMIHDKRRINKPSYWRFTGLVIQPAPIGQHYPAVELDFTTTEPMLWRQAASLGQELIVETIAEVGTFIDFGWDMYVLEPVEIELMKLLTPAKPLPSIGLAE